MQNLFGNMVTKMTYGTSIYGLIQYNESKVEKGEAKFMMSQNFIGEDAELTFKNKWDHFKMFTEMNERTKKNAYHFSINFHKEDVKNLTDEKKKEIASEYLKGIGLEQQPALIYEHFDAAHPHMHIVTTNIDSNGDRIDIYRQVHDHSEDVRKELEEEFELVKAEGRNQEIDVEPLEHETIFYGRDLTKESLGKVIEKVRQEERFTNLEEYQNCLAKFGARVDPGLPGSAQKENNGLVYGFIDDKGDQVGQGIKASRFYNKPIFKNLEQDFIKNQKVKNKYFKDVAKSINDVYYNYLKIDPSHFKDALIQKGIDAGISYDKQGNIKQIHYRHKSSGARYTSDDFKLEKNKLYEKIGGYSYSYKEAKQLSKSMAKSFRNDFRKSDFSYESQYIKNLDNQDFIDRFSAKYKSTDPRKIEEAASNFIAYKNKQYQSILKKDFQKFNKYAVPVIQHLAKNSNLSLDQKVSYLGKMGIETTMVKGKASFSNSEFSDLQLTGSRGVEEVLNAKRGEHFVPRPKEQDFKWKDKQFLSYLARRSSNVYDDKKINYYNYYNKNINAYISPEDKRFLEETINKLNYENIQQLAGKDKIKTVSDIMDHGLVIKPVAQQDGKFTYNAWYYRNKSTYSIPISKELEDQLNEKGYDPEHFNKLISERSINGSFHSKYRATVALNAIEENKEYHQLEFVYDSMRRTMPGAAENVYQRVNSYYANKEHLDSQDLEEIVQYMKEEVENYEYKELQNQELENTRGEKEFSNKPNISPGNNDHTGSHFNKEDKENERLRKRILKKWYNDLEHEL